MEEWKSVVGHEDTHVVSSDGRVAKILKNSPPAGRYNRISIGNGRHALAHVWVLETFVGPRPPGAVARYLNDKPADNRLTNLAWGTPSENLQDAIINGGRKLKSYCPLGHPITGNNVQLMGERGVRCKACNQERANSHWHKRPFDKEAADKRFEEVMQ